MKDPVSLSGSDYNQVSLSGNHVVSSRAFFADGDEYTVSRTESQEGFSR